MKSSLIAMKTLLISCCVPAMIVGMSYAQSSGYARIKALPILDGNRQTGARVELLLDGRLTESLRSEMWGIGDWSFVLHGDSKLYAEFSRRAPLPARLRIVGAEGSVVSRKILQQPLAELMVSDLPGKPFLVTTDYSIGFGSYAGLVTTMFEVSGGHLHSVKAKVISGNTQETIQLSRALKSDWRAAASGNTGMILAVSCHPGKDGEDFVVDYVRYRYDGSKWLKHERTVAGFWESDEPFPPESEFPD